MAFALNRRLLLIAGALALAFVVLVALCRLLLTGLVLGLLFRLAGTSEVRFRVTDVSLWRVVVEEISFRYRTQVFAAQRLHVDRPHWWTPSLGQVRLEQIRVPVNVDGSDTNPWAWSTYRNGTATVEPLRIPADEVSIDGELVVQAAGLEQALTVKIEARRTPPHLWTGSLRSDGPGLALKAAGDFDAARMELSFKMTDLALDVKEWEGFVRRLVVLPVGEWQMEGRFTGTAEGRLAGGKLQAGGAGHLREGRVQYLPNGIDAQGIALDVEFSDLTGFVSRPATLQVRELRAGKLPLHDLAIELAFDGPDRISIARASLTVLGGKIATEPFRVFPLRRELEAVLLVEGMSIEEIMALTPDLPARASGRVDGRFPIRIDASGLRIDTGWVALRPGVAAQVQFNAAGLLTGNVSPKSPSYAVLKKIEAGLLELNLTELRLDIRPPNAPPGRSAQLHLAGSPVDPEVRAPITLDLNVNGPLEKLLDLGIGSRMSFGKP